MSPTRAPSALRRELIPSAGPAACASSQLLTISRSRVTLGEWRWAIRSGIDSHEPPRGEPAAEPGGGGQGAAARDPGSRSDRRDHRADHRAAGLRDDLRHRRRPLQRPIRLSRPRADHAQRDGRAGRGPVRCGRSAVARRRRHRLRQCPQRPPRRADARTRRRLRDPDRGSGLPQALRALRGQGGRADGRDGGEDPRGGGRASARHPDHRPHRRGCGARRLRGARAGGGLPGRRSRHPVRRGADVTRRAGADPRRRSRHPRGQHGRGRPDPDRGPDGAGSDGLHAHRLRQLGDARRGPGHPGGA
jgi:hypothetical protein